MPDTITFPAYEPPQIPLQTAMLFNSLCIRQSPWEIPAGSASCLVEITLGADDFSAACSADLTAGGVPCILELSGTGFLNFHSALSPADAPGTSDLDESSLPAEVREAIFHSMLSAALKRLEMAAGMRIALNSVHVGPQPAQAGSQAIGFMLTFRDGGDPPPVVFARLSFPDADRIPELAAVLRGMPVRRNGFLTGSLREAHVELGFEAGYVRLAPADASALEPGDVLVPDAWTYPKTLNAVVWHGNGRRLAGECSCGENEATLTTPLTEDTIMENAEHKELELLLSFELERRPITIADLEDITPGHAFPLDCGTDSPVTIRANGKAVALGRVVDMGGTLGVQILQKM
jgi:type III secretion protein Q